MDKKEIKVRDLFGVVCNAIYRGDLDMEDLKDLELTSKYDERINYFGLLNENIDVLSNPDECIKVNKKSLYGRVALEGKNLNIFED